MSKSNVIKKDSGGYFQVFDELHKEIVKDDTERHTRLSRSKDLTKRILLLSERTVRILSDDDLFTPDRFPDAKDFSPLPEEAPASPKTDPPASSPSSHPQTLEGKEVKPFFDVIGKDDLIERASLIGAILRRGISREEYDYIEENWKSVFRDPRRFLNSEHIGSLIEEELRVLHVTNPDEAPGKPD